MKEHKLGIVGDGCMARHLKHYLDMENIPFTGWSRSVDSCSPYSKLKHCRYVIILISDDHIEDFIQRNHELLNMNLIHFSGSLTTNSAAGIHPLMTFSKELYSLNEYRNIPFIGEEGNTTLKEVIPELKNPYYEVPQDIKPAYHALCVISGNFTNIIWNKVMRDFKNRLGLPKELLYPYLDRTIANIKTDPFNSLTGPIKREDKSTIKRNIKALKNPLWRKIYMLFNKAYKKELK